MQKSAVIEVIKPLLIVLLVFGGFFLLLVLPRQPERWADDRVGKTKVDFRTIAVALVSYRNYHGVFPGSLDRLPGELTITDRFNKNDSPYIFRSSTDAWVLVSNGPDKNPGDLDPSKIIEAKGRATDEVLSRTYDPSNGIFSPGDVWIAGSVK